MTPVVVTAAVIERDGAVLLAYRTRSDHGRGGWEFPGGKVEAGESPQTCLARELREELGIEVRVGRLVCDHLHSYSHGTIRLLAYRVQLVGGEPQPHVHAALAWVPLRELPRYEVLPADVAIVEALVREVERQ